jgi:MFS family permease
LSTPSPSSALTDAPGRYAALALLAVTLVLGMTTWFSASAVIPQLREAWSLSATAAAWLTIAVQLGFVAGAVVSSALNVSDVLPPRAVIAGGAVGAAVVNGLLVAAGGPGGAMPLRFLTGFFLAGVYPPALKLMATWFRRGRGTALGILVGALTLGTAAPHLVNGLGGLDWRVVVYATSVMTAAAGLLALTVRDGPFPFARSAFDPSQARRAFANRGVRLASLGYFGHMWELYALWTWFIVFFTASVERRGWDTSTAPAYGAFAVIGIGALGCWAGGVLGDRWGRTRTTAAMMMVSATCSILAGFLFGAPPWIVLALSLVWGFTVVADSAQFSAIVTELADQAYVGTALTIQLAVGFTLTVATIWLIPLLEESFGWRWAFAFLAPGPALGTAAMLKLRSLPEAARIAHGRR